MRFNLSIYVLLNDVSPKDVSFHCLIAAHAEQACSVDFDDEFVVTGSDGCTVAVWEKETGNNLHLLAGHTQGRLQ